MRITFNRAVLGILAVSLVAALGCAASNSSPTAEAGGDGAGSQTMADTTHMAMPSAAPTDTSGAPH